MERRPDDLGLMQRALAVAREEAQEFEPMWEAVLMHIIERPVKSEADGHDRDRAVVALERTRIEWQLAYEHKPAPPSQYPRLALDADLYAEESEPLPRAAVAVSR
jgi:hypothetical protein